MSKLWEQRFITSKLIKYIAQWTATLFLYFTASDRVPHLKPGIAFWRERHLFKLFPYVHFSGAELVNIKNNSFKDEESDFFYKDA